mgnify:CR=1 FL=1
MDRLRPDSSVAPDGIATEGSHHIVLPIPVLRSMMAVFVTNPSAAITSDLGISRLGNGRTEWLVRPSSTTRYAVSRSLPSHRRLLWSYRSERETTRFPPSSNAFPAGVAAALVLAETASGLSLHGYMQSARAQWQPVSAVRLIGAGFHTSATKWPSVIAQALGLDATTSRWSRTAGALGGNDILERIRYVKGVIVGAGRTGSLLASAVARLGLPLDLVDSDVIELHNLGEMEAVGESDIGRFKAEALACTLTRLTPSEIVAVNRPILDPDAIARIKACDLMACCVDNDAARLAAGILATLYHKPLCDIGSGIFLAGRNQRQDFPGGERTMGTDIRLLLPADGCLLCHGGLADFDGALARLANARAPEDDPDGWRQQRSGSLRSLNQMATGLALQMIQDLVAARLAESTWVRIEITPSGRAAVSYPQVSREPSCPLCALSGLGDEGLAWLPGLAASNVHL